MSPTPAQHYAAELQQRLGQVLFGLDTTIHGLALALITGGHVLLEGVPGLGKTLLAKALAEARGGRFRRIQCTADLMPSDITGLHVFHPENRQFEFMPGPLFADVVLVDEINRTGPKTQSALLQAMEEGEVTVDRQTYNLSEDFFVIASQNPHELEGTYPLPESQLDRFLLRLVIDYPAAEHEEEVLKHYDRPGGGHPALEASAPVLTAETLAAARAQAAAVTVTEPLYRYVIDIAQASRAHAAVALGLSTRGALALMRCARVEAALAGAEFVTPDHVKAVAEPVMGHRLIPTPDSSLNGLGPNELTRQVLEQVDVPRA